MEVDIELRHVHVNDRNAVSEILVVGSGPSGLVLALSLLKNGVPVRIIEKNTSWRVGQRGAGISPRSLELLESLGVLDHVLRRSIEVPMIRFYNMPGGTETLKEMSPTPTLAPTPSFPYRNFCALGQDNLEDILRIEIGKFGCQVELGVELVALQILGDRVEATINHHQCDLQTSENQDEAKPRKEVTLYKWVVGADGARGTVRKQLGMPFLGETTAEKFIIGDVILDEKTGLDPNRWHMWGGPSDVSTAIRPTETPGLFAFILGGANLPHQDVVCASVESVKEHIKHFTGGRDDIMIKEVVWMSPFTINIRMVEKFKEGPVFVVGDAGHVHSMMGGQGMNTGIQDSFNLGWKLALVYKGLAPPSLLESYTFERVPIVSEMLDITTTLLKRTVTDTHGKGWDRSGSIHQLGVNYRGSAIVFNEDPGAYENDAIPSYSVDDGSPLQPGDRAPDAPGLMRLWPSETAPTTRLFDLFSASRHTAIILASSGSTGNDYPSILGFLLGHTVLKDLVKPIVIHTKGEKIAQKSVVEAFEDRDGYAIEVYGIKDSVFIIRPDGIIGAKISSLKGLKRYFEGILKDI